MVVRIIRTGIGTYRSVRGKKTFGFLGDEVDVHEDDVERFDRLNLPEPDVDGQAPEDAEGDGAAAFPDGEPSEEWSGKQLDAYADAKGIALGSAKTKPEKVAKIAEAGAQA